MKKVNFKAKENRWAIILGIVIAVASCSIGDKLPEDDPTAQVLKQETIEVDEQQKLEKLAQKEQEKQEKKEREEEEKKNKAEQIAYGVDYKKGDTVKIYSDLGNLDDEKETLFIDIKHSPDTYAHFNENIVLMDVESTLEYIRDNYDLGEYAKVKVSIYAHLYDSYGQLNEVNLIFYRITVEELEKINFDTMPAENLKMINDEINFNKAVNWD